MTVVEEPRGRPAEDRGTRERCNREWSGETVGMARIVGDAGSVYHVCDMAVHPDHQRQGLGSRMMDAIMGYIDEHAPPNSDVSLMADADGFYEQWGFESCKPVQKRESVPREFRTGRQDSNPGSRSGRTE